MSRKEARTRGDVMEDASKRIDLAAPLISVRRHGGGAGAEQATGTPCCKPDDDAAAPGGVPFGWERRPGHPKSVRTTRRAPPLQKAPDQAVAVAVVAAALPVPEEAARSSDTLSRVDSCFTVNCSVTGLSDAGAHAGDPSSGGGVMMDRFLPAAKAVAVGSPHPQRPVRKGGAAAANDVFAHEPARPAPANARTGINRDGSPRRLPVEHSSSDHVPSNYAKDMNDGGDDDDEWDVHSTAGFASKRCGLLPTRYFKSTLLLLNPAQAMARYGRGGGGGARRGQARWFLPRSGTPRRDMAPFLRRPRNEPHLKHDASMQTWEEVYINSLLRSDRRGCLKPGTLASELDSRTVRELYTNCVGGVHPKTTHLGLLLVLDGNDEYYNGYDHCSPAQNFPDGAGETASLLLPAPKSSRQAKATANGGNKSRRDAGHGFLPVLEEKTAASRDVVPLLPLPPPKSPSESWLSRALPSVSSKPPVTSFLGINVQQQPRRQTTSPWCSSYHAKVV